MLRKNHAGLFGAFIVTSALAVIGHEQGSNTLIYVCKPLMMVFLSVWFFLNTRVYGDRFTLLIQAGLFFSLLGDIAFMLMERDAFFFLVGLSMFLLALLCYSIGFIMNIIATTTPWQALLIPAILSISLFAWGYWFSGVLMPRVDQDITTAMWAYLFVVICLATIASFRWQRTFKRSWLLVFMGTLFFVSSNAILTLDRFVDPLAHGAVYIWGTYAIAQALTAIGCVWHIRTPTHVRKQKLLKT